MAIKVRPKTLSLEARRERNNASEFPIDDSYTTGIELGLLIAPKGDGTSARDNSDDNVVTVQIADNSTGIVPKGVLTVSSPKDPTVRDITTDNAVRFPLGRLETNGAYFDDDVMVYTYDDSDKSADVFNTATYKITGTVTIDGGTLTTVTGSGTSFDTVFSAGDYVTITGSGTFQIETVDSATQLTLVSDGVAVAGADVYHESDIFKPVYAGDSGLWAKLSVSDAPKIGVIKGGNHIHYKIEQ